jgi:selenocysteine lyase/cysteine desulfurase
VTLDDARGLWQPAGSYLNTASYGLPPQPGWDAMQAALADWQGGRTSWEAWGDATHAAREAFAQMVGVAGERVAVGATVSELVGLVAASVARGRLVCAEGDFTSLVWPWLVKGFDVTEVPLARLAETVDSSTDVVAVSVVQSSSGALADLDAIVAAARARGALVVLDATQACGWLPLDPSRFDAVACAGYKWLCSPRGTAYLTLGDALLERVPPLHAGWFAGEDIHSSYYGTPVRLAAAARRLDSSPAWFAWVAAAPTLELLNEVGVETIHHHDVSLANRFRAGLGMPPGDSAIVTADLPGAEQRLERAGIRASVREGSLRASFHVYTTEADVDAALDALLT